MKDLALTEDTFERFLNWLHPDREQAAQKYEAVRRRLIVFFNCRGCAASEDLADETIDRVIKQVPSLEGSYKGEPLRYFYGVAHKVHLEYLRKQVKKDGGQVTESVPAGPQVGEAEEKERVSKCLHHCLQKLDAKKREMFIQYYLVDKQEKVDYRQKLALKLGHSVNAMRLQIHRLCSDVRACITDCLQKEACH